MIEIPHWMKEDALEAAEDFGRQEKPSGERLQRPWNPNGKYVGNLGEIAFSLWLFERTGIMLGYEIWNQGVTDGGYDFRFRKKDGSVWWIDVKTTQHRHLPMLVKATKGPGDIIAFQERTIFVDCLWDSNMSRASLRGWATARGMGDKVLEPSNYSHWNATYIASERIPMASLLTMMRNEFHSELDTRTPGDSGMRDGRLVSPVLPVDWLETSTDISRNGRTEHRPVTDLEASAERARLHQRVSPAAGKT